MGLFLFSDALVLTRRSVQHTPFTLAHRSAHAFLASVALSCLAVREITHTRCEFTHAHTDRGDKEIHGEELELDPEPQSACRLRREPRLCPGGAASLVGVCDSARGGERALPVGAALGHGGGSRRGSVTASQEEVWLLLLYKIGPQHREYDRIFVASIHRI